MIDSQYLLARSYAGSMASQETVLDISTQTHTSSAVQPTGAIVIGGDHPGLGVVRSLGRRGIPVYVLDDQHCISSYSRYATRVLRFNDLRDERKTVHAVLEVGR